MVRFLKFIIVLPLTIVFLMFAYANRHYVDIGFDPFEGGDIPNFSIKAPLFLALIVSIMIGVIAGGITVWLGQGRTRRALRASRAEADRLRVELRDAKAALPTSSLAVARRA